MRLRNILIVVEDIEKSKKFYHDLFGLDVILDNEGNVILTEGLVLQEKTIWKNFLQKDFDGIILPGGESTVQGKLLHDLNMFEPLKEKIQSGMPVLATCAGMILLASDIAEQDETYFETIPMTVKRNAYGRQLGSFHTNAEAAGIGEIPMTFIRAPFVESVHADASGNTPEILSIVENRIVGVKYKNQMAFAFHPELDQDTRIHEAFLGMIR